MRFFNQQALLAGPHAHYLQPNTNVNATRRIKMVSPNICDSTSSSQPLLQDEDDSDIYSVYSTGEQAQPVPSSLKRSRLLAGGCFGVLLQLCTFGVNSILEASSLSHSWPLSKFNVLAASLVWCCVSSLISLAAMGVLRRHIFDRYGEDKIDEKLLMQLECRFVMGAVYGICFTWTLIVLIDLAHENYFCLIANFITSLLAWMCCCALEWWNRECPSSSKLGDSESSCNESSVV